MYSASPRPGKFEGNRSQLLAEVVYSASLDGADAELGFDEGDWYGLVKGRRFDFIVSEDSQGFVSVDIVRKIDSAKEWADLEAWLAPSSLIARLCKPGGTAS